jgi:hypothetical protein
MDEVIKRFNEAQVRYRLVTASLCATTMEDRNSGKEHPCIGMT